MNKKMFVIPIWVVDGDFDLEEKLDIELPRKYHLENLQTIFVDCYWIDSDISEETKTQNIFFYVNGAQFMSPYSQELISEVIHPAMHIRAAIDDIQSPEINN